MDGPQFSTEAGLWYKKNFEQSAGKLEFQKDVVYSPTGALKLSVVPLCDPADEDCSERAEIWDDPKNRVPYDRGAWFGFAVKLADPIPTDDHRYLIAQWKREIGPDAKGDFSPFLALRLKKGKLFATVETNLVHATKQFAEGEAVVCPPGQAQVWLRPDTNQTRALVATNSDWQPDDGANYNACTDEIRISTYGNLPAPNSGWIDFAIYTKPGPDGSGRIEIFANNKRVASITGHIGHGDAGLGKYQYFKFGPYRAGHPGVWTVYYDDFRRSAKCSDVLRSGECPSMQAAGESNQ
ncbi:MAG: polysaccharide lyase [Hyphomicrobiales bacterium]